MYLFSGDFRTDENTALAAQQTLWVREHNRIVDLLRPLKPHWKAEKLFQEARRINIAQYQHILFKEFLPILIGLLLVSLSIQCYKLEQNGVHHKLNLHVPLPYL